MHYRSKALPLSFIQKGCIKFIKSDKVMAFTILKGIVFQIIDFKLDFNFKINFIQRMKDEWKKYHKILSCTAFL